MEDKQVRNQRFIYAINYLLSQKYAKTKKFIASEIGITSSVLTEILGERMGVSVDLLLALSSKFPISREWLLTGNGSIENIEEYTYKSQIVNGNNNIQAGKNAYINQDKELYIKRLEEEIKEYKKLISEKDAQIGKLINAITQLSTK